MIKSHPSVHRRRVVKQPLVSCDNRCSARYALCMNTMASSPAHDRFDDAASAPRRLLCFILVMFGLAALMLTGCSSYRAPTLSVTEAALADRTEQGTVVKFTINASHDNADVVPLREAHYTLELNGQRVFSGVRSAQCTLSRFGSQQFVIPAAVPAASLGVLSGAVVSYRLSGTLTYITPGAFAEVLFDTGVSRPSVGFSQQGTLDLSTLKAPGTKIGMVGSK